MQTFKRGPWALIVSVFEGLVATVMVAWIGSWFSDSFWVLVIAALLGIAILYITFFSENIKFEVDGDQFRYYQKGKLKNIYNLNNCNFRYNYKRTINGQVASDDIDLYITDRENPENEECIDCSALGFNKFEKMFELIGGETEAIKIDTIEKKDYG